MPEGSTGRGAAPSEGWTARDTALLVVLGAIWGSAFPVIRLGLLAGASPFAFGAARFALAAGITAMVAVARREPRPDGRTLALSAILGGGLLIGAYAGLLYVGEQTIGGGLAAVFVATLPIWTALVGFSILPGERFGSRGLAGTAVGFVGVVVLFLPDVLGRHGGEVGAAVLVLGAAVAASIGSILMRRSIRAAPTTWGLASEFALGALVLTIAAFVAGWPALPARPAVIGSLVYLVVGPSILGYGIYFGILHRAGPGRSNLVAYINPAFGVIVGLALGEALFPGELAGFALIVLGLALLQWDRARPGRADDGRGPKGT